MNDKSIFHISSLCDILSCYFEEPTLHTTQKWIQTQHTLSLWTKCQSPTTQYVWLNMRPLSSCPIPLIMMITSEAPESLQPAPPYSFQYYEHTCTLYESSLSSHAIYVFIMYSYIGNFGLVYSCINLKYLKF